MQMFRNSSISTSSAFKLTQFSSLTFPFNRQIELCNNTTSNSWESSASSENLETFSPSTSTKTITTGLAVFSGLIINPSRISVPTEVGSLAPIRLGTTERNSDHTVGAKDHPSDLTTKITAKGVPAETSSPRSFWKRFSLKHKSRGPSTSPRPNSQAEGTFSEISHLQPQDPITTITADNKNAALSFTSEETALRMAYEIVINNYCSWNPEVDASTFFSSPQAGTAPSSANAVFRPPFPKRVSHAFLRNPQIKEQVQCPTNGPFKELSPGSLGAHTPYEKPMVRILAIPPSASRQKVAEKRFEELKKLLAWEFVYCKGSFAPDVYRRICESVGLEQLQELKIVGNLMDSSQGSQLMFRKPKDKHKKKDHKRPLRKVNDSMRPQKTKIYNTMF